MATVQAIKQVEERNVASEITLMVWSDRMDLVALANVKGEVALHRLTWTKAWTLGPPKEGMTVKCIAWRPDGKIIAIAYSSGHIILVKVENKSILDSAETKTNISCIYWTQDKLQARMKTPSMVTHESDQSKYEKFIDLSSNFLPDPPAKGLDSSNNEDNQKTSLLQDQTDFNLLLVGTSSGFVDVRVFGCFPCANIDLNEHLGMSCSVQGVHLTENLNRMLVTVKDANNNVKVVLLKTEILESHTNELFALALKFVKLTSLVTYLSNTITTITESWESILLEMDNKLSKYASKVEQGAVTADFLELLMFGICSDEMKEFLIQDLTKKGLEKFGQTIEMSYSNIQKLLLKHVMKFGQNITYHLAELRGMARLEHRYKVTGLSEETVTKSILSNGAFLIKSGEMQQIINHSIVNYKAFFRWLYTAIMHVLEEPIPNEIPKMTQQDLAYIAEFLQNFDHIGGKSSQSGFIMERLGQYLSDSPLTIKPNLTGNEWIQFLSQNECVQNHSSILKHFEEMSLLQQFKHLKKSAEEIFTSPKTFISQQMKSVKVFDCFTSESLKISHINLDKDITLFAFLTSPDRINMLQVQVDGENVITKGVVLKFSDDCENFVIDLQLYSNTILSVLLQDNSPSKNCVLYQVPLIPALESFSVLGEKTFDSDLSTVNVMGLVPRLLKNIEGMIGSKFAVSGSRKVGIVLSENRRKIRLYEMEGEEEEDEDADMTNTTFKDSSMSVQDITV